MQAGRAVRAAAAVVLAVVGAVASATPAAADLGDEIVDVGEEVLPGSTCEAVVSTTIPPPPGPGVSTTWYGPEAPASYELGSPTGIFAGQRPRGVMLVIHGGGWANVGPYEVASVRAQANRWRERGWSTVNIDYRACGQSVGDVLWFYDRTRQVSGSLPICAHGMSAGGHLALMIAALRPTLACVVGEGAPTNLTTVGGQTAFDPATGGVQSDGPEMLYRRVSAAFGEEHLPEHSPALFPLRTRVLAATAAADPLVPFAQAVELEAAMRTTDAAAYVDVMHLAAGANAFSHAGVARSSLETFWQHEEQLVAPLAVGGPTHAGPIRFGDAPNGVAQLATSLTASSVTTTAGSTTISLGRGGRFRVETCVGWFAAGTPTNQCRTAAFDTTAALGPTRVEAPRVTATFPRSTTGTDYATVLVTVARQDAAGVWRRVGTSWPSIGLAGIGLTVPPAG